LGSVNLSGIEEERELMIIRREHRVLYWILAFTFLFSTVDAILTIIQVGNGWATEANPFMKFFLDIHPAAFFMAKSLIMCASVSVLWSAKTNKLAMPAALVGFSIYSAIIGWHIHGLTYFV
jgi:hypothetical protein